MEQSETRTGADIHTLVVSYLGILIALASLLLSIYTHMDSRAERVQVHSIEEKSAFWFNGADLYKEVSFQVSNNSDRAVSVIDIEIFDKELAYYQFQREEIQELAPRDIDAYHTAVFTVKAYYPLSVQQVEWLEKSLEQSGAVLEQAGNYKKLSEDMLLNMFSEADTTEKQEGADSSENAQSFPSPTSKSIFNPLAAQASPSATLKHGISSTNRAEEEKHTVHTEYEKFNLSVKTTGRKTYTGEGVIKAFFSVPITRDTFEDQRKEIENEVKAVTNALDERGQN